MSNTPTPPQLAGMGQAGLQFVGQFEMQRVLADFENELLILAGETDRHPRLPEKPLPGR